MHHNRKLSRRTLVCSLALTPSLSLMTGVAGPLSADVELIQLGRQLDSIPAALEQASDHDEATALLAKIETLSAAIAAMPSKTLQGLYVKARATAWALEDDFDPTKESSINDQVAASIVRDLLKLGASPE
jgi:hypothetical protein